MEQNGFNTPSFETSGDKSDDSKEKSKTKKKKSVESASEAAPAAKKEAVADRTKALLDKFLGGDEEKAKKNSSAPPAEKSEKTDKKPETPDDTQTTLEEADATEKPADQTDADAENVAENDPSLEQLTPEEEPEVDQRLIEANIEQLKAEIAATDDEVEIVAAQAAIESLQKLPAGEVNAALENEPDDAELAPEHQEVAFNDEDEPLPFEDEGHVPLTKPTNSGRSASSAGGMAPPPPPSASPTPAGAPRPPMGAVNFRGPAAPNVAPAERTEYEPDYRVNPNATYLLVGGVVGYLIGRRRGRIKTEKRMNVVVGKLEKQVEAKQRVIDRQVEAVKQKTRAEYWASKGRQSVEANPVLPGEARRSQRSETAPFEKPRERNQPASETVRPEKVPGRERPTTQPARLEKSIELSDADVRHLSETITIGDTNLRKIHEARLITDGGLRRLVNEHLQGKDIRRGLAREFLTKELSYERDPRFRDIVPLEANGARPQGGGTAAGQPIQPVNLAQPASAPLAASALGSAAARRPIPVKQKRSAVSTGVLTALSFVALMLAAYAVWLGLTR